MSIFKKVKEKKYDLENRNSLRVKIKKGKITPQEVLDKQTVDFVTATYAFLGTLTAIELEKQKHMEAILKYKREYDEAKVAGVNESTQVILDSYKNLAMVQANAGLFETYAGVKKMTVLMGALAIEGFKECATVSDSPEFHMPKDEFIALVKSGDYVERGYKKYEELEKVSKIPCAEISDTFYGDAYDIFSRGADLLLADNGDLDEMFTANCLVKYWDGEKYVHFEDDPVEELNKLMESFN